MDANRPQTALWTGQVHSDTYGEFSLAEHRLPPGHRLPRHTHPRPGLAVLLRGDYLGTTRRGDHECSAGEAMLVPKELAHSERIGRTGARGLLIFPAEDRLRHRDSEALLFERFHKHSGPEIQRIAQHLGREVRWHPPPDPLAIEGLLLELLAALRGLPPPKPRPGPPRWLKEARELLHDRFADPLSLGEIAEQVGISRSQLARRFRSEFGCSVGEYLRRRRLEAALRLLRFSRKSLAEVALDAGFFDQSHLIRTFKGRFRTTPRVYRSLWQ